MAWEDGTGYAFASITVGKKGVAIGFYRVKIYVKVSALGLLPWRIKLLGNKLGAEWGELD